MKRFLCHYLYWVCGTIGLLVLAAPLALTINYAPVTSLVVAIVLFFWPICLFLVESPMSTEQEQIQSDARMFTWLCAVATPMSPHMDGTFQWRIPTHVLPRARTLRESVEIALRNAKEL